MYECSKLGKKKNKTASAKGGFRTCISMKSTCIVLLRIIAVAALFSHAQKATASPSDDSLAQEPAVNEQVSHYKFWLGSPALSRIDYEVALTRLILDATVAEFGPYELSVTSTSMAGSDAAFRRMSDGDYHFTISQIFLHRPDLRKLYFAVERETWMGSFGYRQLVVHKRNLTAFESIKSLSDLQAFRAGQGDDWADSVHYKKNGIEVVGAVTFDSLFAMLNGGRFDFLPLSIVEAEQSLEKRLDRFPDLIIVPNLILRYDLPMHYYVPKHYPELVRRVEKGMELILESGEHRRLLDKYTKGALHLVESPKAVVIDLR